MISHINSCENVVQGHASLISAAATVFDMHDAFPLAFGQTRDLDGNQPHEQQGRSQTLMSVDQQVVLKTTEMTVRKTLLAGI